jgi:N-acetyl-anhydromuramyl-L-alanine amidase AmpD
MYAPNAPDPFSALFCKELLDSYGFSIHYFIDRDGVIFLSVPENFAAWHAGDRVDPPAKMPFLDDCRTGINHFSIGIELISDEVSGYTPPQYQALHSLLNTLMRHPLQNLVTHAAISPTRKSDPWNFDWEYFCGLGGNCLEQLRIGKS